jgi:hypothetical protein
MTMPAHPRSDLDHRRSLRSALLRASLAGLLGVATALLISCGGSGAGLIPAGNAGPLQGDFEAIASAAQSGNGSCSATESAIQKTEQDFHELPSNVDAGLRSRLSEGITNLRKHALELCSQPLQGSTVTTTTTKSTQTTPTTTTPPTTTETTPPQTTPSTSSTSQTTTTGSGGGTPAPGDGGGEPAPAPQGGTEPGARNGGAGAGGEGGGK